MLKALDEYRKLQDMEFDHVFMVGRSGAIHDADRNIYPPNVVEHDDQADMLIDGWPYRDHPTREALVGYTGQHGYSGPVMHSSEYVGGRLADDILAEPGNYVLVVVYGDDEYTEPCGWAVLKEREARD